MRRNVLPVAVFVCLAVSSPAARGDDAKNDGFKSLFNGKDFTGLKFMLGKADPAKTFSVKDGVLICTGRPNGYFYTDKPYKNYVLRYDWRYPRPAGLEDEEQFKGNSGCLVHIQEPQKIWPTSVEVQGMNRDHGKILFVSGAKGSKATFDKEALKKARHKVGEWNTTEIRCRADGTIEAFVNGAKVSACKSVLTEGPIGWQSEGAPIEFRNILIKELK